MTVTARREYMVLIILLIIFLGFLYPSLRYARREARDGIRRDEVAQTKQELEQYFNKHEAYPFEFDASPHVYVVDEQNVVGATAWHIRAQLENRADDASGFDEEAGRNYYWRTGNADRAIYYDVCGGTATCGAPPRQE